MKEFSRCYKVNMDIFSADLDKVIKNMSKIGDITFHCNTLYIWLCEGFEKKDVISAVKKSGVEEFFCEAINARDMENANNYLYSWYIDRYVDTDKRMAEKENAQLLYEANENIRKIKEIISAKIAEAKENN